MVHFLITPFFVRVASQSSGGMTGCTMCAMDRPGLTPSEQSTVRQCIAAVLNGPFLEDDEFATRIGVDRKELQVIFATNLNSESRDAAVELAINNCMNEIAHGFNITATEWSRWFAVTPEEVRRTFLKWRSLRERNSPAV